MYTTFCNMQTQQQKCTERIQQAQNFNQMYTYLFVVVVILCFCFCSFIHFILIK